MRTCVLFPGQGFQKFGMLASLAAKHSKLIDPILEECEAALPGLELSRQLLGIGDCTDVTPTEIAQPLLLTHGFAHYRVWSQEVARRDNVQVEFGMGHSLGEYTAFAAAGLLSLADSLKLVRSRGEAMREASLQANSKLGMSLFVRPKAIHSQEWLELLESNITSLNVDFGAFNSPSQTVLTGDQAEINALAETLKSQLGPQRRFLVKPLPVSGAFHSRFMKAASERLENLVEQVDWQPMDSATFKIISNVTGEPYISLAEVKKCCVEGLAKPVKWLQSVSYVEQQGVDSFAAMGSDIHKLMEKDLSSGVSSYVFK